MAKDNVRAGVVTGGGKKRYQDYFLRENKQSWDVCIRWRQIVGDRGHWMGP